MPGNFADSTSWISPPQVATNLLNLRTFFLSLEQDCEGVRVGMTSVLSCVPESPRPAIISHSPRSIFRGFCYVLGYYEITSAYRLAGLSVVSYVTHPHSNAQMLILSAPPRSRPSPRRLYGAFGPFNPVSVHTRWGGSLRQFALTFKMSVLTSQFSPKESKTWGWVGGVSEMLQVAKSVEMAWCKVISCLSSKTVTACWIRPSSPTLPFQSLSPCRDNKEVTVCSALSKFYLYTHIWLY